MPSKPVIAAALVLLVGAGCRRNVRYVGVGDVLSVDPAAARVELRHDEIAGLKAADISRFELDSPDVVAALVPGTRVRFELERHRGRLLLVRASPLSAGNPGVHDHTPHHGGVVAMVGMIHLEAVATPEGMVRLYLTDLWRRPLPLDDVSGTVVLRLPDGPRTLPLTAGADALQASGPPLTRDLNASFNLLRAGEPIEANFALALRGGGGAAGIPLDGCVAPADTPPGSGAPRCTLGFARPVAALAATPDGALLLVAIIDLGISAWHMPAATFALGFAAPPPLAMSAAEPPHPEAPNAVVARPDGREVAVALENRVIVYALPSGAVVRAFDGPGGIVRALAWSPDGSALLATTFYHRAAYLLDAADGHVRREYAVEREGAAVAYEPSGARIAVGSELGSVTLYDPQRGTSLGRLVGGGGPVRGLAFAGDTLLAAGDDAVLRAWDTTGTTRYARPVGSAQRLAVSPDGRRAAAAGVGGTVTIVDVSTGSILARLDWHRDQIFGLAWTGTTLASGDAAGRVALWDDVATSPPTAP